jgi:hypothetical protein
LHKHSLSPVAIIANNLVLPANVCVLQLQQLQQEFEQLPHPNMQYPDYYTVPFHAYDEGNLNWQVGQAKSAAAAAAVCL